MGCLAMAGEYGFQHERIPLSCGVYNYRYEVIIYKSLEVVERFF
jgi:hypothetical protein